MSGSGAGWEISVGEVKAKLDRREPMLLIDCRQPDEFAICRINGARLIPLGELANRVDEVRELADGRPVVIHCHHGGRSLKAASILRQAGIDGAQSMAGGIEAWAVGVDPTVARY